MFKLFLLAGDEGFEPPNARTKIWCLTAWRIPNNEALTFFYTTKRLKPKEY